MFWERRWSSASSCWIELDFPFPALYPIVEKLVHLYATFVLGFELGGTFLVLLERFVDFDLDFCDFSKLLLLSYVFWESDELV